MRPNDPSAGSFWEMMSTLRRKLGSSNPGWAISNEPAGVSTLQMYAECGDETSRGGGGAGFMEGGLMDGSWGGWRVGGGELAASPRISTHESTIHYSAF